MAGNLAVQHLCFQRYAVQPDLRTVYKLLIRLCL